MVPACAVCAPRVPAAGPQGGTSGPAGAGRGGRRAGHSKPPGLGSIQRTGEGRMRVFFLFF